MNKSIYLQIFVFSIMVAFMGSFNAYAQKQTEGFNYNKNPLRQTSESFGQIPYEVDLLATTITHSATQNVVAGSVHCGSGGIHADNSYFRAFDLLTDFGISGAFNVTNVSIGIESASGFNGKQLVTVNLYTSSMVFPTGYPGSLTLIGTSDIYVPDQALTVFNIPVFGTAPPGSELVVEIFTPAGPGNGFFIGSNPDGETDDGYILAAACGITAPTPLSGIGFPLMHIVMNVTGDEGAVVGPGSATGPSPANGAVDVLITGTNLTWTNPGGVTNVEVFFGTDPTSLTSVYNGAPTTSYNPGTLAYSTNYWWQIYETDGSGVTQGYIWCFRTEVFISPSVPLPVTADFEDGIFPPTSWTQSGVIWGNFNGISGYGSGSWSAVADFYGVPSGFDDLVTIEYISTGAPDPTLTFDWAYATFPGAVDHLEIYTSTDQGTSWVLLVDMYDAAPGDDNLNPFNLSQTGAYFPADNEWSTRSIPLPANTTNARFTAVTDYGNLLWVDNIQITTELFEDNFDAYTAGVQLTGQTTEWTTWTGTPGTGEDPFVSNAQSFSTPNSVVTVVDNDYVRLHGNKTSGKWYMSFLFYIPATNSGYFNTMTIFNQPAGPYEWGMDAFFDPGGTGLIDTTGGGGDPATSVPFTWTEDNWNQVLVTVDLNTTVAEFWVGVGTVLTKIATWDWTQGGTNTNQLAVNDFFGGAATDQMYIDNYYFSDKAPPIVQLSDDAGPVSIDLPSQIAPGTTVPQATVKNFGTATNTFDVTMTIDTYTSTKTVTALAPDATAQVTFDNYTGVTGGPYVANVTTLLVGDQNPANDNISQGFYVWDDSGVWSSGSVMPAGTYLGGGASYVEVTADANIGHLYSIGGVTASGLGTECYEYNVSTDTWSTITPLPNGRDRTTAAIAGGFVYSIAGYDTSGLQSTDVNKYNITAGGAWTAVAPLPAAIGWGKAVGYTDNYIYHAGGFDGTDYRADVYLYDVNLDTWVSATPMPGAAFGGGFAINGDRLVYIGGASPSGINDAVYVGTITANPAVINWTTATNRFPGLGNDRTITSYDVFADPDSKFWDKKNHLLENVPLPSGGLYRTDAAAWGTDGVIITTGTQSAFDPQVPNPCYVYDIVSDTWTAQENLPIPVLGSALGSVNDGSTWNLIVAGGSTASGVSIDNTQIFTNTLGGTTFALTVTVADAWNMVSVPGINPVGMLVTDWWSGKDPAAGVFKYSGGYVPVTTTAPTEGYWLKNLGAQVYSYPAIQIVPHTDVPLALGWNLIGLYEVTEPTATLQTSPAGIITTPIFEYSGGYNTATNIVPGYGYWAKADQAGSIINLTAPPLGKGGEVVEWFPENWGKIILTDATGINYTLYAVNGKVDLNKYEMPPAPPSGVFDIRYGSGRIAEDLTSSQSIELNSVQYPISVRVENMTLTLQDLSGVALNANINPGETVTIADNTINKLIVSSDGLTLPTEYALEQNYPNPFNPSTTIKFALPEAADVSLNIYNALGEKVAQLVNSKLEAGRYSYQWEAGNIATGMYIYELRTDKFVSVKKMILLK